MSEFENKVVMVTGACGGLGNVVARRFATAGATLVLSDRDQKRMQQLLAELGEQHHGLIVDLGDPGDVQRAIQQLDEQGLVMDVLVHAVGGYAGGKPLHETALSVLQKQLFLNTQTVWVTAGAVAAHMVAHQKAGRIVMTLSGAADKGGKNLAAYAASKAAAQSLVESMAAELSEHNIRVNGVSPSTIDTEANRKAMPNADFSNWVTPDQITDAMMFLASEQAARINGVNLRVYG